MVRNTIQRSLVLEAVREMKSHPTAEEVYAKVSEKHATISKGTVYRNLNQLAEDEEIRKLEVAGGADHFDHCCQNHYHVRCVKCGHVFDVDMAYMADLEKEIRDTNGFEILGYDLMFKGICAECRKESEAGDCRTEERVCGRGNNP